MDDSAPAASYTGRLDVDRLAELRELDDPGESSYVVRAIDNLVRSATGDLAAMRTAAEVGDADQLRAVAHRLAGSALNLGAVSLGEAAREVEQLVMNGELAAAHSALADLAQLMAADLDALRDYQREQLPVQAG